MEINYARALALRYYVDAAVLPWRIRRLATIIADRTSDSYVRALVHLIDVDPFAS